MSFQWDFYRESTKWDMRDPPALEDSLANQLLATVIVLLKQNSHLEEGTLSNTAVSSPAGQSPNTRPNTATFNTRSHSSSAHMTSASLADPVLDDSQSLSATMRDLMKSAGRIIFYVSASNWSVVFSKLRGRFMFYSGQDEFLDL
jgi:hypothetical protein